MGKSTVSPISPLQNEATGEFVVNDEDKARMPFTIVGIYQFVENS
jgi:hypothetical protein